MRHIFSFVAICLLPALAIISIGNSQASAQGWTKLHTFDGYISLAKFLDANTGFVGLGISLGASRGGPVEIDKTTDGGATWIKAAIPPGYNGGEGEVSDILMVDSKIGWAAICCRGGGGNKALWHTIDGGLTWNETQLIGEGTSVRITPKAMVVTDIEGYIHVSTDGGNTFSNVQLIGSNCADFVDPVHGAISAYRGLPFLYSNDGGLTWQSSNTTVESWSVYGDSGTSKFYAAPEGPTNGAPYISQIYKSTDYGVTWNAIATLPFLRFTGHLEGIGDKYLFAQADALLQFAPPGGFYYSTDTGVTWNGIGGPLALNDTRFSVLNECQGITIYGFDTLANGSLLQYRFDTSISTNGHFSFSNNPVHSSATLCKDTIGGLRFYYYGFCDSMVIQSITLLDSNSIAVTNGAFGFDTIPQLPLTLRDGTDDSIGFYWNPAGRFFSDTTFVLRLKIHDSNEVSHAVADTIITIDLAATHAPNGYGISASEIDMGSVSTCSLQDTSVTVYNYACFPILLDSVFISGSSYSILSGGPATIAPGDSVRIAIRFSPTDGSKQFGILNLSVNEQGTQSSHIVEFYGQGVQGEGILSISSTLLNAGSFSVCAGDTTVATTISDSGCDTLVITNVLFGGDATFTLVSQPTDSILAPNASESLSFYFAPRLKGAQTAKVTFHYRNLHGGDPGHDTTITIEGVGLNGTTALAVDSTLRNFGSIYICEQRDTSITLYNTGCDTLTVNRDSIYNLAYSSNSTNPIVIAPDDSASVQVSLNPIDSVLNGTITFFSNANSGSSSVTVPLTARLLYPVTLQLVLSPSDSAKDGDTVAGFVILRGSVPSDEISALHFDITHNDDLLGFIGYNGNGISLDATNPSVGIVTQSFTLSPIPTYDTVAELKFEVFLTDSSNTSLALSNVSFVNSLGLPEDCIASIGDSGAAFTHLYRCGDIILREALEGNLRFSIISIQPNPAKGSITVKGSYGPFTIFDPLGRSYEVSGTSNTLDISSLPSGVYFVSDGYSRAKFVKE